MKRLPDWLIATLVALAVSVAVAVTWRMATARAVADAEARERDAIAHAAAVTMVAVETERRQWSARLDSARTVTAARSSALDSVTARSRSLASRIAALNKQSADSLNSAPTVKESLIVAARADSATAVVERDDAPTLRACGVQLDALALSCDAFRASATRTIAVQDSALQAGAVRDSVRAVQLAAITRSDAAKALALAKRPTWWTVTKGAAFGAAVGLLVGVFQ